MFRHLNPLHIIRYDTEKQKYRRLQYGGGGDDDADSADDHKKSAELPSTPTSTPSSTFSSSTMHLINIDDTFRNIRDILNNREYADDDEAITAIKNNYYMVMDIALSVVMDIKFMNDYFEISLPETDRYTFDENTIHSLSELDDDEYFSKLFDKMTYISDLSINPYFTKAEIKILHHMIHLCYAKNNDRYHKFVKMYHEAYRHNRDYMGLKSKNVQSIWDAKNCSLIMLFHIIYENLIYNGPKTTQNSAKYIGICKSDTFPEGHIFYIKNSKNYSYSIEAIGIQQSFIILLASLRTGIKYNITRKLFDHLIHQTLYKNALYMYAYAWPIISNILVQYYDFTYIQLKFCLKKKTECEMKDIKNIEDLYENKPDDLDDFMQSTSNYIFTYKKIESSSELIE